MSKYSTTSTCTERGWRARARSEVTHHYSAPDATLAAGQVPCHLQNCYYHESDIPPSMPIVPLWPCRVCFGRHECTPTSTAPRLGPLPSNEAGRNGPPPSVPSTPTQPSVVSSRHICYAQHLTINFYLDIDVAMHNRSIFNLYDCAV